MTDNDRTTALEARIAMLESMQCNCSECQSARKQRIAEQAVVRQLEIERSLDAIAQVRKMAPSAAAMFWQRCQPERAIELLISPEITDEERERWTPIRLRDRVELELIVLPPRVRVRLVAEIRFTPLHIVVANDSVRKLQAAGLGDRLVRVHDDVTEFVPLQVTKDFSPVVERQQLDAILKIDERLSEAIAAGEIVI